MRKKLLLVASLFLTMSLVGCNGTPAPESKGTGTDESQHSAPIAETSNNENKSSIDDATASKEKMKSEADIRSAIGATFKISADSLPEGTPSTSASDGTYHYATSRVRTGFYKKIGDLFYQYTKENRSAKYNKLAGPVTGLDVIKRDNVGGLFMFADVEYLIKQKRA